MLLANVRQHTRARPDGTCMHDGTIEHAGFSHRAKHQAELRPSTKRQDFSLLWCGNCQNVNLAFHLLSRTYTEDIYS